jgi:thiamine pyrophosphokinase
LAGGDPLASEQRHLLPDADLVVAADSGLHEAGDLGLRVDVVVGDFDSADPDAVAAAQKAGAVIERHAAAKDATDLELAIDAAVARGATRVTVVGGSGGRLDHLLANVGVLASPRFAELVVDALFREARVVVLQGGREPVSVLGPQGSLVTLLPVGGDGRGISTTGLEYPLRHEDLPVGTSRGVSNLRGSGRASVGLDAGTLLLIQPFGGER